MRRACSLINRRTLQYAPEGVHRIPHLLHLAVGKVLHALVVRVVHERPDWILAWEGARVGLVPVAATTCGLQLDRGVVDLVAARCGARAVGVEGVVQPQVMPNLVHRSVAEVVPAAERARASVVGLVACNRFVVDEDALPLCTFVVGPRVLRPPQRPASVADVDVHVLPRVPRVQVADGLLVGLALVVLRVVNVVDRVVYELDVGVCDRSRARRAVPELARLACAYVRMCVRASRIISTCCRVAGSALQGGQTYNADGQRTTTQLMGDRGGLSKHANTALCCAALYYCAALLYLQSLRS